MDTEDSRNAADKVVEVDMHRAASAEAADSRQGAVDKGRQHVGDPERFRQHVFRGERSGR